MHAVLLDTNVWSWSLLGNKELTVAAQNAIDGARLRYLSPISIYEISNKVRLGKWPEIAALVPRLRELAEMQDLEFVPLDADVCRLAGTLNWDHRDPFDRMLGATALLHGLPIISADDVFDSLVTRIW